MEVLFPSLKDIWMASKRAQKQMPNLMEHQAWKRLLGTDVGGSSEFNHSLVSTSFCDSGRWLSLSES